MQEERDVLVKKIFPQLRKICVDRGVGFTEVELRWGVTEERVERGEVLPIWLAEIENCRPYFIGFLGERNDWVPEFIPEELSDDQPRLKENRQRSVTEPEIEHGVLHNPKMAGHAFFYFHDVPLPVAEAKKVPRQGIECQVLGNHYGETVDWLTHIGCVGGYVNLIRNARKKHHRLSSTVSNLSRVAAEKSSPTATHIFPGRMIVNPDLSRWASFRINAILTGTNVWRLLSWRTVYANSSLHSRTSCDVCNIRLGSDRFRGPPSNELPNVVDFWLAGHGHPPSES